MMKILDFPIKIPICLIRCVVSQVCCVLHIYIDILWMHVSYIYIYFSLVCSFTPEQSMYQVNKILIYYSHIYRDPNQRKPMSNEIRYIRDSFSSLTNSLSLSFSTISSHTPPTETDSALANFVEILYMNAHKHDSFLRLRS